MESGDTVEARDKLGESDIALELLEIDCWRWSYACWIG